MGYQNDWEEPDSKRVSLDSSTTPGDIQIKRLLKITSHSPVRPWPILRTAHRFGRIARFEDGKFGKGVLIEEGQRIL